MSQQKFDLVDWHPVKNVGTQTIPSWGVMRITGMEVIEGRPVYTVDRPNGTLQRHYLINDCLQIKKDQFGNGTFDPQFALVETGTPAYGEGWGVQVDSFKLKKGHPGFTCMGGYTTTDANRAVFRPDEIWMVQGKLDGSLSAGSSATCSIWTSSADTNINITVNDFVMASGESVASGRKVYAAWTGPYWAVTTSGNCGDAD